LGIRNTKTGTLVVDSISLTTTSGGSGSSTGEGTIENDDSAAVSIGDASVTEGGDLEFDVSLTNPVDVDTVITYSTADGTATTGDSDYTGKTDQTLTILAGQTTGIITVATTPDDKVELDETLSVVLGNIDASGRNVFTSTGAFFTSTQTGAQLLANPNVSFPDVVPVLNGTSLTFSTPLANRIQLDWNLLPAASRGELNFEVAIDYTPLSVDNDIKFGIADASRIQGVLRADNYSGSFYSLDGTRTGTTVSHSITRLSTGVGLVEPFDFVLTAPDGGTGPSVLTDIVEGTYLLSGPINLPNNPINTDSDLSLIVSADSNNNSPFEVHSIAVTIVGTGGGSGDTATGTILNDDYAPVADAGPARTIDEGDGVSFDASATTDADSTTLTYRWDVDGDGSYDENVTALRPVSHRPRWPHWD